MKSFEKKVYRSLVEHENFYMKQYYSNIQKKEIFIAVKEIQNGIYCVLICNTEYKSSEYIEAIEYIKSLKKNFSLNTVILSSDNYIDYNYGLPINKIIVNRDTFEVLKYDESCLPLKHIIERLNLTNRKNSNYDKKTFLKYKTLTLILITINVIVFLAMQIRIYIIEHSFGNEELSQRIINIIHNSVLISFGAKYNELINNGQIWRLLTCAFLHSSFIHILSNMYSLYIIGPEIEEIYGWKKYLPIYIISCLTASISSYFMNPNSISVGASGGIFGLMGAMLTFAIIERNRIQKKYIYSLIQIIFINLFIGLSIENIDNFAHIGGLIGGMAAGYLSYKINLD